MGAIAVVLAAVALALFPVLIALGRGDVLAPALVAAGGVAAVVGGLKWAALAWGLASRGSEPELRDAAPVVE